MDKLDRRLDQVILQSSHFQTRIQVQIIHAYLESHPFTFLIRFFPGDFNSYIHIYIQCTLIEGDASNL